jgi:phosphonate transport system substrate-binding protein
MRKTIFMLSLWGTLLFAGPVLSQDNFVIGVAPHTSARVILRMYQPLRLYLEKALRQPVEIVTAPDFTEFARRGLQREYDIAITTGHQAELLHADAGYIPLLTYKADFTAVVIVARKGQVKDDVDLQGKRVLGLSPSSLVTLWGEHWLVYKQIKVPSVTYVSASDSVAKRVISGQADAGLISRANFDHLTPDVQAQLHILVESPPMAGRVYLLNRRHASRKDKIEAFLWSFADTPAAQRYFAENSLAGYRKLRAGELQALAPFAEEVRMELRREKK